MDKVKDAIIEDFEKSMEAWRGLATTDNMFLIGRIDAYELAIATVKHKFKIVGTGHWIHKNGEMYCSECGEEALMDEVYYESPYCPHCGVRMFKEENGNA